MRNVAFNLGLFFLIGAGFGHWTSATISLLTGITTGEVMIFTQPVGALRTFQAHESRISMLPMPWFAPGLGASGSGDLSD